MPEDQAPGIVLQDPVPETSITALAVTPLRSVYSPQKGVVAVPIVSLPVELAQAGLGGVIAGLGTFTGTLTATSASNATSLKAAAIGAGFTAIVFFANSLKTWYGQRYGSAV